MFSFFFKTKEDSKLEYESESQILKSMCILNNKYLLIGKIDGNLLIYEIERKKKIFENKISDNSITCLMNYEKDSNYFFACSESPEIYLFELYFINNEFILKQINKYVIHQSCVKRLKSLGNNTFVSCSNDSSLVIWDINGNILYKLKDQSHGLENFIIKISDKTISNLVTLNEKGTLSFYKDVNNKLFLSKVILELDYTNLYSMCEISGDRLFVGGFSIIQIFSIISEQMVNCIKIKEPISFIFEKEKHFIVFGFKNGKLEFRDKNKLNILGEKDVQKLESKYKFSNLFKNGEIQLFENESIISFDFFNERLICISDEKIRFWNCSKDKKRESYIF